MILIADSGSTKCTWAYCDDNGELKLVFNTVGFNPKYSNYSDIINELQKSQISNLHKKITKIFFYGAGCSSLAKNKIIYDPLKYFFSQADIHIRHDLEAAVKATYKDTPIISCILGTGSNSCFFDGENIIENAPSLGYILGDEASGNYFGKKLINLYVNNLLTDTLLKKFETWTKERKEDIIKKIYSVQRPNLYLATFFKFMYENKDDPTFDSIFKEGIQKFFDLHIKCFNDYQKHSLTFVGSVAYYLSEYIKDIAKKEKIYIQDIIKSPIKNLVKEHFSK